MVPARDRALLEALRLTREGHSAVSAAIANRKDLSIDPSHQDAVAENPMGDELTLRNLVREQGGVPMVAESELGLDVLGEGRALSDDLGVHQRFLRHDRLLQARGG